MAFGLELLKKGLINDEEFGKANSLRRDERAQTEMSLAGVREEVAASESKRQAASALPGEIKTFL